MAVARIPLVISTPPHAPSSRSTAQNSCWVRSGADEYFAKEQKGEGRSLESSAAGGSADGLSVLLGLREAGVVRASVG